MESRPRNEWRLDPLFWDNAKLPVKFIKQLRKVSGIEESFFFCSRPLTRVKVVAVVTSLRVKNNRVEYILDDGSGSIPCTKWTDGFQKNAPEYAINSVQTLKNHCSWDRTVALGDLVAIHASLRRYQGEVELVADHLRVVEDPNEEPLHWLQCIELVQKEYTHSPEEA
mmetsp:Transcript_653/g.948  ORF Transcript_653/g.948 Transcript_653/m.948 type:complete len:168 (+) Transcript_653:102-605(+)